MDLSPKSIYAYEKVKSAIRDHENDVEVSITIPKTRVKVVVVGSSGVGKTSLIYQHRYGECSGPYTSTIGASFVECEVESTFETLTLQIWDTAGQERFRCMVPMYMRNAASAIIMYDVTNRQSFDDVEKWSDELRRCCGIDDPLLILVGNKCDLSDKRLVSTVEGRKKAKHIGARFYEVTLEKPITFSLVLEELCIDLLSGSSSDESSFRSDSCSSSDIVYLTPRSSSVSSSKASSDVNNKCCGLM